MDDHSVITSNYLTQLLYVAIDTQGTTMLVLLLFVCLFLSFVLSGAEVAFFSLTYKDINLLKTKEQPALRRIVDLLEAPKTLLASLLIANSFVNVGIIVISNVLIDNVVEFEQFNAAWVEFLIKVLAVTFMLVLFGEVMPKVLATQNNIRFAKDFGGIVQVIAYATAGMSRWLVKYSDIIEKKLADKRSASYSLEELDHAIDITSETTASEKEKNILKGIVKFGNIAVKQIMRARLDVHGIEYSSSFDTLVKAVAELNYSRLPVYKDDLDEVVGIIHTKDLLPYINNHELSGFDWHSLIRPAFFVHEQKLIEDLLQEFRNKRIHFAVVVDEFGGTSGIVTLEDIMEEIIGDIRDEFDEEELGYKKIDDTNFIFEGRCMIYDVCKIMELPLDTFDGVKGDSDSIAGLVLELAGEIPAQGAVIPSGDFEFTVMELEKNRIQKIKVSIQAQAES